MNRKIICIVIALLVLSISAILVANPNILGGFSSTVNGVPVQVTISRQDNGTITTMRPEDFQKNWADYNERFVRFMGVVESVDWSGPKGVELVLDAEDPVLLNLFVYPLDTPHVPTEYQEGHVYEFTGFLTSYLPSLVIDGMAEYELRIYAFEIRHHGPMSESEHVERLQRGD